MNKISAGVLMTLFISSTACVHRPNDIVEQLATERQTNDILQAENNRLRRELNGLKELFLRFASEGEKVLK